MGQEIKNANIFGRIGSGVGQGLAEQLPKEIERSRLAYGLEKLANQKDLTPFQQFAGLASTAGATPQIVDSGTQLLKQQARGQALAEFQGSQGQSNQKNNESPAPFPINITNKIEQPNENKPSPSLTKGDIFEKVQEGYIPPTQQEKTLRASQLYNENPGFFGNDPQQAIDYVDKEAAQDEKVAAANQVKYKNLDEIQKNVVSRLQSQADKLGVQVPADLFSKIEDEAIQATKPKKEGGEGLSEQQAMKKYGKKLNDASRLFEEIAQVGDFGITGRDPQESIKSFKSIQNRMEELGETDNMAKLLTSRNKLSPQFAYSIAEPVNKISNLNKKLKDLPVLYEEKKLAQPFLGAMISKQSGVQQFVSPEVSREKTLEIAPSLAKFVKENEKASPLAISYELKKKGYDPSVWLEYLVDNEKELNLRSRQSSQASTPLNIMTPWNDWWLSSFTGIK